MYAAFGSCGCADASSRSTVAQRGDTGRFCHLLFNSRPIRLPLKPHCSIHLQRDLHPTPELNPPNPRTREPRTLQITPNSVEMRGVIRSEAHALQTDSERETDDGRRPGGYPALVGV